jgi:transcription elongation factor Elf1
MLDVIDIQYAHFLSTRFEQFKVKATNPYKFNFRCPICSDSQKSKTKARGWILENRKHNSLSYHCFNCGSSYGFSNFLKTVDIALYNQYVTEKYVKNARNTETKPETSSEKPKVSNEPKKQVDHLKSIKKISSLAYDHPAKIYVEKRGIPSHQHYRLYYAPKFKTWINSILPNKFDLSKTEKDEPRLIIPLLDSKKHLFGVSARSFDPTSSLRYITIMFEERPKFFGLDQVDFSTPYIVTEGALDSLFLSNSVAMVGADGNLTGLDQLENAIFTFDREPRNQEIHKRMEKIIRAGYTICIWPSNLPGKDINEMILAGMQPSAIEDLIMKNRFKGLEASLKLMSWRKT